MKTGQIKLAVKNKISPVMRDKKKRRKIELLMAVLIVVYVSSIITQFVMVTGGEIEEILINPIYVTYIFITSLTEPYHLLITIGCSVGCAYLWMLLERMFDLGYEKDEERNIKVADDGTYGTQHWMDAEEKEAAMEMSQNPADIKLDILGIDKEKYVYGRKQIPFTNANECIIGPPGSGKSTCKLNNDILQSIVRGDSYLVVDSKGTVYRDTMYAAKKMGYTIRIFDIKPKEIRNSDAVDFFKIINDDKLAKSIANSLASTIVMNINDENAKKDIWYTGALNLLKAAILITKYDEEIPESERTFGTMYMTLVEHSNWMSLEEKWGYVLDNRDHPAYEAWKTFTGCRDVIKESVLGGLLVNLNLLSDPMIREIVSNDEIDLELPGKEKCAYYLVMDDQDDSNSVLASLFVECLSLQLKNYADSQDIPGQVEVSLPVHVNFLIDEFKSIGKLPGMERKLSTYRSRGMLIKFIIQDLSQLEEMYPGVQWKELISCCTTMVVLAVGEINTAKYIEERLGGHTAIVENNMDEMSKLKPVDFHIDYRKTAGKGQRALMTAAEIMGEGKYGLKPTELLVIINGQPPLKLDKWFWTNHPLAKALHLKDESRKYRCKDHIPQWRAAYDEREKKKEETMDIPVSLNQMTMTVIDLGKEPEKKKSGGGYARKKKL